MSGLKKNVFSSCLSCSKKVKEFYISQKAGNAESVGFFNLQVCGLKEKWYLNIFIRSVTLQNGGFVTHPYPYWEQHPGSFAGLNATDSSTFTESLPSKAAHLGAWGWLHVGLRSHVRIQYQEEYSTCKEHLENARSEAVMIRMRMPLWRLWIQWQAPDTL